MRTRVWRCKNRRAEAGAQLDLSPQTLKEPRKRRRVYRVSRLAAGLPSSPARRNPKAPNPLRGLFLRSNGVVHAKNKDAWKQTSLEGRATFWELGGQGPHFRWGKLKWGSLTLNVAPGSAPSRAFLVNALAVARSQKE